MQDLKHTYIAKHFILRCPLVVVEIKEIQNEMQRVQ